MRDPEMVFEVDAAKTFHPVSFTQDNFGIYHEAVFVDDAGQVMVRPRLVKDLTRFAYLTGWRHGEIVGLRWDMVNMPAQTITLPTTKNGRPRVLDMAGEVLEIIQRREQARLRLPCKIRWHGTHQASDRLRSRSFIRSADQHDSPQFLLLNSIGRSRKELRRPTFGRPAGRDIHCNPRDTRAYTMPTQQNGYLVSVGQSDTQAEPRMVPVLERGAQVGAQRSSHKQIPIYRV